MRPNEETLFFHLEGLLELMYLKHENTDLYLEHCGMQHCEPGHRYDKVRSEYHVHFVLAGKGTLTYRQKTYHLHRGDIFVIPPQVGYVYQADMADPWYYAWVGFNGTCARKYLNQSGLTINHVTRRAYIEPERFTDMIHSILIANKLTVAIELLRLSYLYEILALLMESNSASAARTRYTYSSEAYVEFALKYIEQHYQERIRVNDIVSHLGINRSYFCGIFKQEMQMPPLAYLQNYRLTRAKKLLRQTNLTVRDIAAKVGYGDAFTFSKVFRRSTGSSPTAFRKSGVTV